MYHEPRSVRAARICFLAVICERTVLIAVGPCNCGRYGGIICTDVIHGGRSRYMACPARRLRDIEWHRHACANEEPRPLRGIGQRRCAICTGGGAIVGLLWTYGMYRRVARGAARSGRCADTLADGRSAVCLWR